MTKTAEELEKKYQKYVDNLKWHINTNKPKGKELDACNGKLSDYTEMLSDILSLERVKPQPLPINVSDFIEKEAEKYADTVAGETERNSVEWVGVRDDFFHAFTLCYSTFVEPLKEENEKNREKFMNMVADASYWKERCVILVKELKKARNGGSGVRITGI